MLTPARALVPLLPFPSTPLGHPFDLVPHLRQRQRTPAVLGGLLRIGADLLSDEPHRDRHRR